MRWDNVHGRHLHVTMRIRSELFISRFTGDFFKKVAVGR